jgi:NAD(P)-dependent dehydrogenase (short-subunit alcohol dehydrogenase family)
VKPLEELSTEEWNRVIATNLQSVYLVTRYLLPLMPRGASIINIASTRALMSEPNTEAYSASKGGILALTHAMAISLAPRGIRVNAISPGWIETSNWKKRSIRKEPLLRDIDHLQHPAGRVGKPEDIAYACLFLSSEEASFITGVNLVVDGGMTVKMIYAE